MGFHTWEEEDAEEVSMEAQQDKWQKDGGRAPERTPSALVK